MRGGRCPRPIAGAFPTRGRAFPEQDRRRALSRRSERGRSAAAAESRRGAQDAEAVVPRTWVKNTGERERARRCQGDGTPMLLPTVSRVPPSFATTAGSNVTSRAAALFRGRLPLLFPSIKPAGG